MTVEDEHVYNVAMMGVLVHNNCEIYGNPQVTGTPGHDTTSLELAQEQSALPGAQSVHMNQTLNTITNGAVPSNLKPDVATVFDNGQVNVFEIPSNSQTPAEMQDKIDHMEGLLGGMAGPGSAVVPIH
jgi:hypothetical protein